MSFRLFKHAVLVKPDPDEETTPQGLIYKCSPTEKLAAWGEVIAVGPDQDQLKPGDRVYFSRFHPKEVSQCTNFSDDLFLFQDPENGLLAVEESSE